MVQEDEMGKALHSSEYQLKMLKREQYPPCHQWYVIEVHGEKHIHLDKRHGWSINPSHGQRMSLSGQRGQYGNQL